MADGVDVAVGSAAAAGAALALGVAVGLGPGAVGWLLGWTGFAAFGAWEGAAAAE
jgi:hypothetical protein